MNRIIHDSDYSSSDTEQFTANDIQRLARPMPLPMQQQQQQQQQLQQQPQQQQRNVIQNPQKLPYPDKNGALPSDERSAFEEYLFTGEVQKALTKLVAGTPAYLYLLYLDKMKSAETFSSLEEHEKSQIRNFFESGQFSKTSQAGRLGMRFKLLSVDDSTLTPEERTQVIESLVKNELQMSFDRYTNRFTKRKAGDKAGNESLKSALVHEKVFHDDRVDGCLKSYFDAVKRLDTEKQKIDHQQDAETIKRLNKDHQRNLERHNEEQVTRLLDLIMSNCNENDGVLHTVDFSQWSPKIVYTFIIKLGKHRSEEIASIQNESIFKSIVEHISNERRKEREERELAALSQEQKRPYIASFALPAGFGLFLTLQQMDKLVGMDQWFKTDENFIGAYFQKQNSELLSLENQEVWDTEQKLQNLTRLFELSKAQNHPTSLQLAFLTEILDLSPKLNQFNEELFREYLSLIDKKDHRSIFQQVSRNDGFKQHTDWNMYIQNVQKCVKTDSDLILKYLTHFCKEKGSLNSFNQIGLIPDVAKNIERQERILSTTDGLESLGDYDITPEHFKRVSDQVFLRFVESNKEIFSIEEEVSLRLNVKNIKQLDIKIFEFNTETYYMKNKDVFNTGVNLEGLEPAENIRHEYEQPANVSHDEVFTFPQLNDKIGLFIVEFIGNGKNARAVIKKGMLSLVHKSTIAGHLVYMIDHKKLICKGGRTGVWFDSKYYEAEKESGRMFIPYGRTETTGKIIMINGQFAQIGDFRRKTERYEFSAHMFVHQESILLGMSTKLVVRPQLFINGRKANVNLVKNVKVVVTTNNYIDKIPVTKNFNGLKFENDEELTIQFQIPPNLSDISVHLTCQIENATTKKTEHFNHQQTFPIFTHDNHDRTHQTTDAYLRKTAGEYSVFFLGKNGEPQADKVVACTFHHRVLGSRESSFITDSNGSIHFGDLLDVNKIAVKAQDLRVSALWHLKTQAKSGSCNWKYPNQLEFLEGEEISMPINLRKDYNQLERKWFSVIRSNNAVIVEDWFDAAILEHFGDEDSGYHTFRIPGLQQGSYSISFVSGHQRFNIKVKVSIGSAWEGSDNFILKKHCLQENIASTQMLKIKSLDIEQEEKKYKVSVQIDDCTENVRLHAIATQFVPSDDFQLGESISNLQNAAGIGKSIFHFAKWTNFFISDRTLSDEVRYVLERKDELQQLGNVLERPSLLLNRFLVGATTFDQEQLCEGDSMPSYNEMALQHPGLRRDIICPPPPEAAMMYQAPMMQNCMPMSQEMDSMQSFGSSMPQRRVMAKTKMCRRVSQDNYIRERTTEATELQNFLKTAPMQKYNLKPASFSQDSCVIEFEADLSSFTQLYLLVVDKDSVVQTSIDLDEHPIKKRDLRLKKVLDKSKGLTETRLTTCLTTEAPKEINNPFGSCPTCGKDLTPSMPASGMTIQCDMCLMEKIEDAAGCRSCDFDVCPGCQAKLRPMRFESSDFIEDITSSEIMLIDDLAKVNMILKEVRKVSGSQRVDPTLTKLSDLVRKWPDFTHSEKNTSFATNTCYELHLFLKHKDPAYFKEVVRPFIACKMEKFFMDHYLLDNYEPLLSQYSDMCNLKQLNTLEKCLLIDVTVKAGQNHHMAKSLSERLQLEIKRDSEVEYDNKVFDCVLNLNTLSNSKNELEKLKKEKEIVRQLEDSSQFAEMHFQSQSMGIQSCSVQPQMQQMMSVQMEDQFCNEMESLNFAEEKSQSSFMSKKMAPQRKSKAMPQHRNRMMKTMAFKSEENESIYQERNKTREKEEFQEKEKTSEYMENHYYAEKNPNNFQNLIPNNQFWCDFAKYLITPVHLRGPFLTPAFTQTASDVRQSILALAVLDLPFKLEAGHAYEADEQSGVRIRAASNLILFKKQIQEAPMDLEDDIMVIHRYQKSNESEKTGEGVPEEFLAHTPYTCEVILTNVSPKTGNFTVLYQIPLGSMPLAHSKTMKSHYMTLTPYTTEMLKFDFYFPKPGVFNHFPSNISIGGLVKANGGANILNVVAKATKKKDIETFQDLLADDLKDEVLGFLETENLMNRSKNFRFEDMAYLLKNKEFFDKAADILRNRGIFDPTVWSFSCLHKNVDMMREYFEMVKPRQIFDRVGSRFNSSLVTVDAANANHGFNTLLEYHPMINARAHVIGREGHQILNRTFRATYDQFLSTMVQKRAQGPLSPQEQLTYVYYLQLQDRIDEAIKVFSGVPVPGEDDYLQIQYDYLLAYFDFFTGGQDGYKVARKIVQKYDQCPLSVWRLRFLAILDQLNEFDGEFDNRDEMEKLEGGPETAGFEAKRAVNKKESKRREPNMTSVELHPLTGDLTLESVNIKCLQIKYYIINAEILFSRQPFLKENAEHFSYVKPFHTVTQQMCATEQAMESITRVVVPVHEDLKNKNMVIEVIGAGKQEFRTYYSNKIKVQVLEVFGELKVMHLDTGRALPNVYVKVFGQKKSDNSDFFFRDGYTDICGKFDYAQTSGDKLKDVKKFAILIQSDEHGSKIQEVDPPKNTDGGEDFAGNSGGMQAQKMKRLENRSNFVKQSKSKQ